MRIKESYQYRRVLKNIFPGAENSLDALVDFFLERHRVECDHVQGRVAKLKMTLTALEVFLSSLNGKKSVDQDALLEAKKAVETAHEYLKDITKIH